MKIPRDVSGARLAGLLCRKWEYARVHQVGSHIILETPNLLTTESRFRTTVPSDSEPSVRFCAR